MKPNFVRAVLFATNFHYRGRGAARRNARGVVIQYRFARIKSVFLIATKIIFEFTTNTTPFHLLRFETERSILTRDENPFARADRRSG
jgi:hypothetical protein